MSESVPATSIASQAACTVAAQAAIMTSRSIVLAGRARAAASAARNGLPPSFKLSSLQVAALCAVRLRRTVAGKPARVGQCGTPPQPVSAAN